MIQSWYGRGYAVVVDKIGYRDMAADKPNTKNGEIELTAQYYHKFGTNFLVSCNLGDEETIAGRDMDGQTLY